MALSNVDFIGNKLSRPPQTYSYTQQVRTHRLPCEPFRNNLADERYRLRGFVHQAYTLASLHISPLGI